jgi:hypothetical protein
VVKAKQTNLAAPFYVRNGPKGVFGSVAPEADVPCGKRSKSVVDEPDENQRELDWL